MNYIKCSNYEKERKSLYEKLADIFPTFVNFDDLQTFIFIMKLDYIDKIKTAAQLITAIINKRGIF